MSKAEALDELLQNCLKLAAQDKISSKNSWELQLIEHIEEVIPIDTDFHPDFIRISGAIQASAKIYSGRVDHLYDNVQLVANQTGQIAQMETKQDEETDPGKKKRKAERRNANIDAEPEKLLRKPVNVVQSMITPFLRQPFNVQNNQIIQNLPLMTYQFGDFCSLQFIPQKYEGEELQIAEHVDELDIDLRKILQKSQRFEPPTNLEQPVQLNLQLNVDDFDREMSTYTSVLDNSVLNMEVSQLESVDAVNSFFETRKLNLQWKQAQEPPRPKVPKPGAPKPPKQQ